MVEAKLVLHISAEGAEADIDAELFPHLFKGYIGVALD